MRSGEKYRPHFIHMDITGLLIDELQKLHLAPIGSPHLQSGIINRYRSEQDKEGKEDSWVVYYESNNGIAGSAGNWRTGDKHKFNAGGKESYIKKAVELEKASSTMTQVMREAIECPPDHLYFTKKKVHLHRKLKVDKKGNLLIPLTHRGVLLAIRVVAASPDDNGKFDKWSIKGSKPSNCYYIIEGNNQKTVYIAEGYATAATAAELTGCVAVMAGSASNLTATARAIKKAFPDAEIIIVADNNANNKENTGLKEGLRAARAIRAKMCIPPYDGDLNDAISKDNSPDKARGILASADAPDTFDELGIPDDFIVTELGVFRVTPRATTLICNTPIFVIGYTRSPDGRSWGREIQVVTRDGQQNILVLPAESLIGNSSTAATTLASEGAVVIPGKEKLLMEYIMRCNPKKRGLCATRLGWLDDTCQQYVLPHMTVGINAATIKYQSEQYTFSPYSQHGDVESWRENIGEITKGNEILVLAVCMALIGPLGKLLDKESFGIHLYGEGSIGKSTTAKVAASIWGRPSTDGFLQTWRNTKVAIEELARIYNDNLLILDEVGEIDDPRDLQRIIFMLTGGQSKGRGKAQGGLRNPATWNTYFFSTGNGAISTILRQAGGRDTHMHAGGQAVRRIEIGVAKRDQEIFTALHGEDGPEAFAILLQKLTAKNYGAIGMAFLDKLIANKDEIVKEWISYLSENEEQKHEDVSKKGGGGQQLRVYGHFQLLAFAGTLATKWGLTGWETETARDAIRSIYSMWFKENLREGTEKTESIRHVRLILQQKRDQFALGDENIKTIRIGYRQLIEIETMKLIPVNQTETDYYANRSQYVMAYFVSSNVFAKEFCQQFPPRTVKRWLRETGMLLKSGPQRFGQDQTTYYHTLVDIDESEKKARNQQG